MKNKIEMLVVVMMILSLNVNAQNDKINFEAPKLYPEGIAFNPKTQTFYVSSVTTGTISTIDKAGKYKIFYSDKGLKSSFGMKVDVKRNRLWICVSDPNFSVYKDSVTFKKMARVISLDLATAKKDFDIDLAALKPGKHFANDLTFDDKGNVYITDSFSPIIYKIDSKGTASIFITSALFDSIDVGLNGIVYHPAGFLIAAHNTNGTLLMIPITNPKNITKIKMNTFFPGADGLLLDDQQNLILIQNKGVDKIYKIASKDNWKSAEIIAATFSEDRFQNPTTATMDNNKIYILNSKLNELSDSTKNPSKDFSMQMANFNIIK